MAKSWFGLFLALALMGTAPCALGDIYKYVDESGRVIFTDKAENIPSHELEDATISKGGSSSNPLMRVEIRQNQVLVPVTIDHGGTTVKGTFLLDTGATSCTISPGLAKKLGIGDGEVELGLAQVAGGGIVAVGNLTVGSISVGPKRRHQVEVGIMPTPGQDGLLGMSFLRHFRYRIDYQNQTILWED